VGPQAAYSPEPSVKSRVARSHYISTAPIQLHAVEVVISLILVYLTTSGKLKPKKTNKSGKRDCRKQFSVCVLCTLMLLSLVPMFTYSKEKCTIDTENQQYRRYSE
jgi:hypothetical protein